MPNDAPVNDQQVRVRYPMGRHNWRWVVEQSYAAISVLEKNERYFVVAYPSVTVFRDELVRIEVPDTYYEILKGTDPLAAVKVCVRYPQSSESWVAVVSNAPFAVAVISEFETHFIVEYPSRVVFEHERDRLGGQLQYQELPEEPTAD